MHIRFVFEGYESGITLLTNSKTTILDSLSRIGYDGLDVEEIEFTLNVPKGINFYSAHFKIDVFKYHSMKNDSEYSLLLESELICKRNLRSSFKKSLTRRFL